VKFQFATDLRDVVLENVLLLKSATALEPDLLANTALNLFAPIHARMVESVLLQTLVTVLALGTLEVFVMSQSAMLQLDVDLEFVLPTKPANAMLDGRANTALSQSVTLHVLTENALDQTPATALEPTTLELSAKPQYASLSVKMDLFALPLILVTALPLDLDGVDQDAKLLIVALTLAKTEGNALPLVNATVLILDTKDLLVKLMKMSAKDSNLHAIKDSNASMNLDLTSVLELALLD